jgi:hypothetical protein
VSHAAEELEDWQERSAAERRVSQLMAAIGGHPALAEISWQGFSLLDFAEPRLRLEVGRLLRGWELGAPAIPHAVPPALPGSRRKRALARPLMRALATVSPPARVRIAVVVAGKLGLALDALANDELRELGVGAMPFPGLDHGNGALFALRRRRPLLATYSPAGLPPGPLVRIPARLDLHEDPQLDRALALLIDRMLAGIAPELAQAVAALAALERARTLRAIVLPSAGYGASRLLIAWAHQRGLRVGSMQHGIFAQQDVEDGERRVDMVFGWGQGTIEQALGWGKPRPPIWPVGLPGMTPLRPGNRRAPELHRVLIATTSASDALIAPVDFCENFIAVLAPSLQRLAAAGVELQLRPHPSEDPAHYQRLLDAHRLDVAIVADGTFAATAANADLVISSTSSVAFEAAGLGLPVLLWLGGVPQWVRQEHLVVPWTETLPGMFNRAEELAELVDALLRHPTQAFAIACELAAHLRRFAEPFQRERFGDGLRALLTTPRRLPAAVR